MHHEVLKHPDVKAARKAVEQAAATIEAAEQKAAVPPLPARRLEDAKQQYDASVAALHAARKRVAQERIAKLHPKYVDACRKLAEAVRTLAPLNDAVADLEEEVRQINGGRSPFPSFALTEFLSPTPNGSTRLSSWLPSIQSFIADNTPRLRPRLLKRKANQ